MSSRPPVLAVADALVVAMADAVPYVANEQSTPRGAVLAGRGQLDHFGAHILGTVRNDGEANGTGYAYDGQYVSAQQAPTNGHLGGLRKKSRAS
jgi:hypothetical protein